MFEISTGMHCCRAKVCVRVVIGEGTDFLSSLTAMPRPRGRWREAVQQPRGCAEMSTLSNAGPHGHV
jgi:hypothetical protein